MKNPACSLPALPLPLPLPPFTPTLQRLLAATVLGIGAMLVAPQAQAGVTLGVNIGLPLGPGFVSVHGGRGYGGHGGYGGYGGYRGVWGGPRYIGYSSWGYTPWLAPAVIVAAQPSTVIVQPAAALAEPVLLPQPSLPGRPEPVIYPRNGQSAQQLEADRQDCNRWATQQPAALNDSSVFMRAVDACLDGRGYTSK